MSDGFYSLTMLLEMEADFSLARNNTARAFFLSACATIIAREENR